MTDHLAKTLLTDVTVIGHGPDGALHRFTENGVVFEEYVSTVIGVSGTTYGITLVRRVA